MRAALTRTTRRSRGTGYRSTSGPSARALAELGDQLHGPSQSTLEHQVGVRTPLESIGCRRPPTFHAEVNLLHSLSDQDRVEMSRLDQDVSGRLVGLGATSAHDARQGDRAFAIGDHQGGIGKRFPIGLPACTHDRTAQKLDALAVCHPADDDFRAPEILEVECVQRLAPFIEDVVGDVDDIVDRPHSSQQQPCLEPRGRGRHVHAAQESTHIPWAQLGLVNLDADSRRPACGGRFVRGRVTKLQPEERRHFPGDPDQAQKVRPVGQDVEFQQVFVDLHRGRQGRPSSDSSVKWCIPELRAIMPSSPSRQIMPSDRTP